MQIKIQGASMKVIGIIPARMASSRFPGKPMFKISGRPMVEHVYKRAELFKDWDHLGLATCDKEIFDFGKSQDWKVVMTSDKHIRCLDRIAEAAPMLVPDIAEEDIVVCVQGDEPMLHPDMIEAAIAPLLKDKNVHCTVLAMDIIREEEYLHRDCVKLVHNLKGDVLYTSRSPIPHADVFTPEIGAKRIYGIFAFRWKRLKEFTNLAESPLEVQESCDSNRFFDHGFSQRVAPFKYVASFAVDNPHDIQKVEGAMAADPYWGKY